MTIDIDHVVEVRETARAEMRSGLAERASEYVAVLERSVDCERRYATDPDRDDIQAAAKAARAELDKVRAAFDNAVKGAKATHTRRVNEAIAEGG